MTSSLPASTARYLDGVRDFYDTAPTELRWGARGYRALLAHYYNLIVPADASVLEIGCGSGELLSRLNAARKTGLDLSPRQIEAARRRVPGATFHVQAGELLELDEQFDVIIISDTLNLAADVQLLLERLQLLRCQPQCCLAGEHVTLRAEQPRLRVAALRAEFALLAEDVRQQRMCRSDSLLRGGERGTVVGEAFAEVAQAQRDVFALASHLRQQGLPLLQPFCR